MKPDFESIFIRLTKKAVPEPEPSPLLIELCPFSEDDGDSNPNYPFIYHITVRDGVPVYEIRLAIGQETVSTLRHTASELSRDLDPSAVDPLTFARLIEVLSQLAAKSLAARGVKKKVRELSELSAYEAIGLSRILGFAKDGAVTEVFVDSDATPVYLDHREFGRCETEILLTERERDALETHLDTFSGYTVDYRTPSLKNDLQVAGAILRVSLDLEPVSVNRFSLDIRRLNVSSLTLPELVGMNVLSKDAATLLVRWLEGGGNITIVGETGTGKTTLLNALDEQVERRFRRLYIEDAVETRDMLASGYHQMKVKVDPFERGGDSGRTKESEIVKALHRSPDLVILSEIQSEEHSRAFFQALASGSRGMQTFHASSIEQAIRRWVTMHHVEERSLLDLGLMVQMARPDRLRQERYVQRVCEVVDDRGLPKLKEIFIRNRRFELVGVDELEENARNEGIGTQRDLTLDQPQGAATLP